MPTAFRRKRWWGSAIPAVILVYLVYVFFAFDVPGLMDRANLDNAVTLVRTATVYKTHVTRDNRSGEITYAKEGERKGTYPEGTRPDWVVGDERDHDRPGRRAPGALRPGQQRHRHRIPGFSLIEAGPKAPGRDLQPARGSARLDQLFLAPRLDITHRGRAPDDDPLAPRCSATSSAGSCSGSRSTAPITGNRLSCDPVRPAAGPHPVQHRGRVGGLLEQRDVAHKDVAWAIGETILMAFLGTMGAAMWRCRWPSSRPSFTPMRLGLARPTGAPPLRLRARGRCADLDDHPGRAFGPGPLTGALAILITDTGTFGKLFSEALENVDGKQIEGVTSTGARPLQRYRFGVIPQIMPVLLSRSSISSNPTPAPPRSSARSPAAASA
jgi:phosphonate transport system permease protein